VTVHKRPWDGEFLPGVEGRDPVLTRCLTGQSRSRRTRLMRILCLHLHPHGLELLREAGGRPLQIRIAASSLMDGSDHDEAPSRRPCDVRPPASMRLSLTSSRSCGAVVGPRWIALACLPALPLV